MDLRQPDIEIYLKRVPASDIISWLAKSFTIIEQQTKGDTLHVCLQFKNRDVQCSIVEGAAKGGYTALWFQNNDTAWDDDRACALEAYGNFSKEIRFANGSWVTDETEEQDGGWVRVTEKGESVPARHALSH